MRAITNAGGTPSFRMRSDCVVCASAVGRVGTSSPRLVQRATAHSRGTNIVMAPTVRATPVIQLIGVSGDVRYFNCFLSGGSAADFIGVGRPVAGCTQPVELCRWLWPCAAPQLAPQPARPRRMRVEHRDWHAGRADWLKANGLQGCAD
jgi:hypothetical protein